MSLAAQDPKEPSHEHSIHHHDENGKSYCKARRLLIHIIRRVVEGGYAKEGEHIDKSLPLELVQE